MTEAVVLPSEGAVVAADAPVVPGTPAYDAKILARADAENLQTNVYDASGNKIVEEAPAPAPVAAPAPAARPEWIPEKFWDGNLETSSQKLAKSYGELEKAKQVRGDDGKFVPKEALKAEQPVPEQAAAAEAVKAAGMDFDALSAEFQQNGNLSAETFAKLEAGGIPQHVVNNYIEGQKALSTQYMNTAYQAAGGSEESYKSMVQWANANLSKDEISAYDKTVVGDLNSMKMAVAGLHARYVAAVGTAPKTMEMGGTKATANGGTYSSMEEIAADMKNPKYKTDPSYRKNVEAKAARSNF